MPTELGIMFSRIAELSYVADDRTRIDEILSNSNSFVDRDDQGHLHFNREGTRALNVLSQDLRGLRNIAETYIALARWDDQTDARWTDDDTSNDIPSPENTIAARTFSEEERFVFDHVYLRLRGRMRVLVERDLENRELLRSGEEVLDVLTSLYDTTPLTRTYERPDGIRVNSFGVPANFGETDAEREERLLLTYTLDRAPMTREVREQIFTDVGRWVAGVAVVAAFAYGAGMAYLKLNQVNKAYPTISAEAPDNLTQSILGSSVSAPGVEDRNIITVDRKALRKGGQFTVEPFPGVKLRVATSEVTPTVDLDIANTTVVTGTVAGEQSAIIVENKDTGAIAGKIEDPSTGKVYVLSSIEGQPSNVLQVAQVQEGGPPIESDAEAPPVPAPAVSVQDATPVNTAMTPLGVRADQVADILFVATPALSAPSTRPILDAETTLAANEVNQGWEASNAPARIRKRGLEPAPDTFNVNEAAQKLHQIKEQASADIQQNGKLAQLLDQYKADILVIVAKDNGECGNSYIMSKGFNNSSFKPYAVIVVTESCMKNFHSLLHELMHNIGESDHQLKFASIDDASLICIECRGGIFGPYADAVAYLENGAGRINGISNADNPMVINGTRIGDATHNEDKGLENGIIVASQFREPAAPFVQEVNGHKIFMPLLLKQTGIGQAVNRLVTAHVMRTLQEDDSRN